MSTSNLDHVKPNVLEISEISWESSGIKQDAWYCQDEEHIRKIFRKLRNIPVTSRDMEDAEPKKLIDDMKWQMRIDLPILPESRADLDETVIPFWTGIKPPKTTWRTRVANWLIS